MKVRVFFASIFLALILVPTVIWGGVSQYIVTGGAAFVNTASLSFTIADSDHLNCGSIPPTTAMSVCFWTKDNPVNSGNSPISLWAAQGNQRSWLVNTLVGKAQVLLSAAGSTPVTKDYQGSQTVFTISWKQFCFTLNTTLDRLRLYGDRVLDSSVSKVSDGSVTAGLFNGTGRVFVGAIDKNASGVPASFFTGKLDHISIWNIELDSTGINATASAGKPADLASHPNFANLQHWYRMGEAGDTIATNGILDSKGSAHCNPVNLVSGDIVADVP